MAKTLQTRIVLRYGTYSDWTNESFVDKGANLVLLPGEIGICEIPADSSDPNARATTLFKVGGAKYEDGSLKKFKDLPWASANAYDVNAWAKASDVVYNEKNKTITFVKGNADGSDKVITFKYATIEEVEAITNDLTSRVAATEAALEKSILDSITAISNIEKKLGGEYSESSTIFDAIADAKTAGTSAQKQIKTLADVVATNTNDIASNASSIAANLADIVDLGARIEKIEAFFGSEADREDGSYGHLSKALDTLIEIQACLTGDGEGTGDLIYRIAQNESAVKSLQATLTEGGAFEKRVTRNEASISGLTVSVETLAAIIEGYTTKGSIKTAIEAVDSKASDAQAKADNLAIIVGNENSGLVQLVDLVKDTADSATVDIAALGTRLDTVESTITDIQSLITGAESNAKLREDITDLQDIVKTGANANVTLRADIAALQELVNNKNTGLAEVKEIADEAASLAAENASRLAAIEEDYLREIDNYLFNCGDADTIAFSDYN